MALISDIAITGGGEIAIQAQSNNEYRNIRVTGTWDKPWSAIRWYGTFPDAVKGLAQMMIRTSDAQTLDALVEVDRVVTRLSGALQPNV